MAEHEQKSRRYFLSKETGEAEEEYKNSTKKNTF
jgi:hypothetical protein